MLVGKLELRACLHGCGGPQVGEVTRYNLSFYFVHVYMIGRVTRRELPHLPLVPRLHVNRP